MADIMQIRVDGFDELERRLEKADKRMLPVAGAALRVEGQNIMGKSVPLVPVDDGPLRDSGVTQGPQPVGSQGVEVVIGYGGAAAAYARRQHEELEWRHTSGQAKYLEEPFLAAMDGIGPRLAARIAASWAL